MRPTRFSPFLLLFALTACGQADGPTATRLIPPSTIAADVGALCAECVFGPETFTRGQGQPNHSSRNFSATPGPGYTIDIDDLATEGADGIVTLNGTVIMDKRAATGAVGPRHITVEVSLQANNVLEVRMTGKKGSQLKVAITRPADPEPDCFPNLPSPVLEVESATIVDNQNRYELNVLNFGSFPADLFVQSPDLPPCDENTTSARAWVDIYDADTDAYVFGFCAFNDPSNLNFLWFSVPASSFAPRAVYIKIHDRKCDISYQSNDVVVPPVIIE